MEYMATLGTTQHDSAVLCQHSCSKALIYTGDHKLSGAALYRVASWAQLSATELVCTIIREGTGNGTQGN